MSYCRHCGEEVSETDEYCVHCGEKWDIDTARQPPTPHGAGHAATPTDGLVTSLFPVSAAPTSEAEDR